MHLDLEYAIEQLDLYTAMEEVEKIVKKLNDYGHIINANELIRDYY